MANVNAVDKRYIVVVAHGSMRFISGGNYSTYEDATRSARAQFAMRTSNHKGRSGPSPTVTVWELLEEFK